MKKILSIGVLIYLITLISCNDDEPVKKEKVTFSLIAENILNSLGNVQDPLNAESVKAIYVTVSNENGEVVLNNKKLALTLQDENYTTEPVRLKAGEYTITEFKVVDDSDNITFETPLESSSASELVSDALPIVFGISQDEEDIKPQVLSTTESIGFKLGVYTFNAVSENFEISAAEVEVISGSVPLTNVAIAAVTSQVDVEKTDSYVVTVTKAGYLSYTRSFSLSELQAYASQALYIRLYAQATATNLAVYYPFSGNANDASGNVHHGVNNGAILSADRYGNFNSSYHFDGANYIDLGNILDDLVYPFTVSAWVKREAHPATPYNPIFTSQEGSTVYNGFDFAANSGFTNSISIGDGRGENNSAFRKSKSVTTAGDKTNVWTHVCAVVNGNNDMKIYIDGVELVGDYSGDSSEPMDSNFPDDVAVIGKWSSNGQTSYFKGYIDELRVWKRALTSTEINGSM